MNQFLKVMVLLIVGIIVFHQVNQAR